MNVKLALFLLISAHIAGIVGIGLPVHPQFVLLTPFNLFLSLFIVLHFHENRDRRFWIYAAIATAVGFLIEVVGINTGLIFGHYQYDVALGPKIWGTPPMIGINWLLTSYLCGIAVHYLAPQASWWVKALLGGAAMTAFDVLVEPVAMRYQFWSWENDTVPLQNYAAWFVVGSLVQYAFFRLGVGQRNRMALVLLACQLAFFIALNFW
ncbi:MAG: carotenoid biosynthesis protein [Chitinophagales bacterium]|nr:carotenoid biosynthesis protein [Chitinophagales bacterium]